MLGLSACGPFSLAEAADKTETKLQKHRVLSREGQEVGTRTLRITETPKDIEIVEELEATQLGKKVGIKTAVRFSSGALTAPLGGNAETSMDGHACMKGSISFSERDYRISGTAYMDRKGSPLPGPMKFGDRELPLPPGTVIFRSALSVLGPRLLPKNGELKGIVFVEFPEDIKPPELVKVLEKHRLVRESAPQGGGFTLKLFDSTSNEPKCSVEFGAGGQLRSEVQGKLRFVHTEEKESR
jgi:hypothetical protein